MYWVGLIAWLMSGICISIIGFRHSVWYGSRQKLFEKLTPLDMRLAKIAALFFVAGVLCFVIGTIVK
jgi:hypothetical protein